MFEDFTYITDELFLSNFWLEERIICFSCRGKGTIALDNTGNTAPCHRCRGTGFIQRKQIHKNPY